MANDEIKKRLNDINEKFKEKSNENLKLVNELQDLKSQLEISELRVQQVEFEVTTNKKVSNFLISVLV